MALNKIRTTVVYVYRGKYASTIPMKTAPNDVVTQFKASGFDLTCAYNKWVTIMKFGDMEMWVCKVAD